MGENLSGTAVTVLGISLSLGVLALYFVLGSRGRQDNGRSIRARLGSFTLNSLPTGSFVLVLAGLLGMGAAVLLAVLSRHEGLLQGKDLYTLRMPEKLEVTYLNESGEVTKGDVIARFRSPQLEAEHSVLGVRCDALESQQREVERQPLEPDPRLVQREKELENRVLYLRGAVERMTIEQSTVQRERLRTLQAKREQITALEGTLAQIPQQLVQTRATLAHKRVEEKRAKGLLPKQIVTANEYDKLCKEVAVLEAEVARLEAGFASSTEEKAQLEKNSEELETLMAQQAQAFDRELQRLQNKLASAREKRTVLDQEMADDLATARERRAAKLDQIKHELTQCQRKMAGLEQKLEARAPESGQVAYRTPSPSTAYRTNPLLVIAPENAFRLRVRIPTAQAQSLRKEDSVSLEVLRSKVDPKDTVGQPARHLVRRFPAQPVSYEALAHQPTMSVMEMQCHPPAEAVRDLALGGEVQARLLWMPPLLSLPLFRLGLVPAIIGILGMAISKSTQRSLSTPVAAPSGPKPANAHLRSGDPDITAVRLLGEQLGQSIREGELDPALVATIEWVLDHHGLDGARALAQGLEEQGPVRVELKRLASLCEVGGSDPESQRRKRLFERLCTALDVIVPEDSDRSAAHDLPVAVGVSSDSVQYHYWGGSNGYEYV